MCGKSITTNQGDQGKTSILGKTQVWKDQPIIQVIGDIDELNSLLGVAISESISNPLVEEVLVRIQKQLFCLGAMIQIPSIKRGSTVLQLTEEDLNYLEQFITKAEIILPELKAFLLPGGSQSAAYLHFARTVCRRTERNLVSFSKSEEFPTIILAYINRLSDVLFLCARLENQEKGKGEYIWDSSCN